MSDKSVVHIGENSPEQVALKLFEMIAAIEKTATFTGNSLEPGWSTADKNYILTTYGECINTVRSAWYKAK